MNKCFLTIVVLVFISLSGCVNAYNSHLMMISCPNEELKKIVREALDECLKDEKCGNSEINSEK